MARTGTLRGRAALRGRHALAVHHRVRPDRRQHRPAVRTPARGRPGRHGRKPPAVVPDTARGRESSAARRAGITGRCSSSRRHRSCRSSARLRVRCGAARIRWRTPTRRASQLHLHGRRRQARRAPCSSGLGGVRGRPVVQLGIGRAVYGRPLRASGRTPWISRLSSTNRQPGRDLHRLRSRRAGGAVQKEQIIADC